MCENPPNQTVASPPYCPVPVLAHGTCNTTAQRNEAVRSYMDITTNELTKKTIVICQQRNQWNDACLGGLFRSSSVLDIPLPIMVTHSAK
mmetsp:Transcript_16154/g.44459  ORF Transcript_16154/g.44459 Transcript_16154/m.44459 type:complete len:90 (+) Transcript_16154:983-1252(+)